MSWAGLMDSLKSFIKWREARNSQKKRFNVLLSDAQAIAIQTEVSEVRALLNAHVKMFHEGEKPVKLIREKEPALPSPPVKKINPYPLTEEELKAWLI